MGTTKTGPTVLMLPWLAHGHISPFLELAKQLTTKNFFIYLCSTPINLLSIKKKLNQNYSLSIKLVELHLPTLPNLPPQYHTTNGLPPHLMSTLKQAFEMSKPDLLDILKEFSPDLFLHDMVMPWSGDVASSLKIPAITFLPTGATAASFFFRIILKPHVEWPFPGIYLHEFEITKLSAKLEGAAKDKKKVEVFGKSVSPNILLIKSFGEIEGKYINFLGGLMEKKVIPAGPLVADPDDELGEDSEVIEWLNKKDKSSSVFVSFGSEYFLSKEQMEEIAHGLELSNVNFIWVVRFPAGERRVRVSEALPEGFLERVGERGMIVEEWAPQAKILKHENIGGFVSHCGWGSILESMKFGVPIIALPMHLDQPLNARLVVEVGVGTEVARDKISGRIQREDMAKKIREVVVEKGGEGVREKAKELREKLKVKGDEETDELVQELVQIYQNKGSNCV